MTLIKVEIEDHSAVDKEHSQLCTCFRNRNHFMGIIVTMVRSSFCSILRSSSSKLPREVDLVYESAEVAFCVVHHIVFLIISCVLNTL